MLDWGQPWQAAAVLLVCLLRPSACIECYSGSQLSVVDCPSISCIKQTLAYDTVRYCDGVGVSSICTAYRLFESCDTIPSLGFVCCCSGNLCNSADPAALFAGSLLCLLLVTFLIHL